MKSVEREPNMSAFISVDIEASGPIPGDYSLLSIGACLSDEPSKHFYIELKPISPNFQIKALEVSGLDMNLLAKNGVEPLTAMTEFSDWLNSIREDKNLVMVAYSATFDWMFVNFYFHHFLGHNPLGHSAIDLKALYMGVTGCEWQDASKNPMSKRLGVEVRNSHNALGDAVEQAELFNAILALSRK